MRLAHGLACVGPLGLRCACGVSGLCASGPKASAMSFLCSSWVCASKHMSFLCRSWVCASKHKSSLCSRWVCASKHMSFLCRSWVCALKHGLHASALALASTAAASQGPAGESLPVAGQRSHSSPAGAARRGSVCAWGAWACAW